MLFRINELQEFAKELSATTRQAYLKKLASIQRGYDTNYIVTLPNGGTRIIKGMPALSTFTQLSPKTIKTYLSRGAGKFATGDIIVQREE